MGKPSRGYIRVDLCDNCNIRCIMCQAYNSVPIREMQLLDFDTFVRNTTGEIANWSTVQLGNVAEPTIHPRFADFVRYIRSQNPETTIHVVTNGRLLHKFATLLNESGPCTVQVSMDSVNKEMHEYIRAGSDYDRVMANLELLDPTKVQVLLSFTLMRSNIDEYPQMAEFCRSRGYHMSCFPMIVRQETNVLPYNLIEESLWFHREKLQAWLRDFYGSTYALMVGTASGATTSLTEFTCNAHHQDLGIDARGNTNLCYNKVALGNILKTSAADLWNAPAAVEFRQEVDQTREPCVTCDYRLRCLSPSMALLDNHFAENLLEGLTPETRETIGYHREISDEEARWRFIQEIGQRVGIFDIREQDGGWIARRVIALEDGTLDFGSPIESPTRHELHQKMQGSTDIAYDLIPTLVERVQFCNIVRYRAKYWVLPLSLGVFDLSIETNRRHPEVVHTTSLEEARQIAQSVGLPPELIHSEGGNNYVRYRGSIWEIPQSLGHVDLTTEVGRTTRGVRIVPADAMLVQIARQ
jgi:radical SAM protein with 4Fe4S-binding SPASM domain